MLQRIQTVYWFIAAVLLLASLMFPYANIEATEVLGKLYISGLQDSANGEFLFRSYPLAILLTLCVLCLFVAIFSFRRPKRQQTLSIWSIVLSLGILILEGYYIYATLDKLEGVWIFRPAMAIPLVAAFFAYLGYRGVRRDQAFLQKMSRL